MRFFAVIVAASLVAAGCASNSYEIPGSELQRLAAIAPEARGQHVRVIQQLHDSEVGPARPVTVETQIVVFPQVDIGGGGRGPRRGEAGNLKVGHGGGSGLNLHDGGGNDKAVAIVYLAIAAAALVVVAAIEGNRFDGYAQLHPMHPVYLFGRDGTATMLPLAWIDPPTAAWADHAIVRNFEGPWHELERAPLSREGLTYAVLGGIGTSTSADGTKGTGPATTIQFGYFPEQTLGIVGSIFFGWRDDAIGSTLFESRYTAELQDYPLVTGPLHLGLYGGGGAAYRIESGFANGNSGSLALVGGALVQLDINTRLALTARLGATYAHDEAASDAMFGLSVY